ncbi:heavy metal-associated isoprenylated plant protein 41 [Brassica rapa]|uniref:heavy metal-associated isoprenylated plant protein 41 n=1 Tax=Brassica campestris TaxID=3711 RepID=UPI000BBE5D13|nr:heavy metal-associated isoprenylated plant protein 41 [Brassica rapa]
MVNLQRQRKKIEEKHELEEEIGGSENVRTPNYLVEVSDISYIILFVQQRIVLKIDMSENEKAIKKAMKLASGASGVRSVGIQGQNDQLVVVGAGIDTAELTRLLRKKVCPTTSIVTVQAAPPPRPQQQQQQPQFHLMEHHNEMAPARRCICEIPNSGFCGFCRLPPYQMVALPYPAPVVYREESDGCRIM